MYHAAVKPSLILDKKDLINIQLIFPNLDQKKLKKI